MIIRRQGQTLYLSGRRKTEYPMPSILMVLALLYLAPLTSMLLAIPATALCLYRVLRYNARVYAVDYCLVAPVIALSRPWEGVPLLLYLSLFAAIWYFCRSGFRVEASYVILVLVMNYFFWRMEMQINAFILCFGQMFVLCILLPEQDADSAERAIKVFCWNLIVSSIYAWMFRRHPGIRAITGADALAIWGTNIIRFKGLFGDPNYYMTLLTVAIAALLKLKDSNRILHRDFWIMLICLTLFGILTYSKTFFLMFVLLIGIYVVWQFWNRKVLRGLFLTIMAVLVLWLLFTMENSPFEVVLIRLTSARTLKEFTTSRSDLYVQYYEAITESLSSLFFGQGLAAKGFRRDPHNLYLEIAYYLGVVGLLLFVSFYISMVHTAAVRTRNAPRQNIIAKYEVILIVVALFFTLHGMFEPILYANLFVAYLSVLLTRKQEDLTAVTENVLREERL